MNTESESLNYFSRPLSLGDYILLSIVDTQKGKVNRKIAKITKMKIYDDDDELEVIFLQKSTSKRNAGPKDYCLPRFGQKGSVSKNGIIRILRRIATTSTGDLCFYDLDDE